MRALTSFRWAGAAFYLATAGAAFGQIAPGSSSSSTAQPVDTGSGSTASASSNQALQNLLKSRQSLLQQEQALLTQGATAQQLAAWREQNAPQFAALQEQAESLGASSYLQVRRGNIQPNIPAGASQTLKDFLTTRATLMNARALIHNQIVQPAIASGHSLTVAQVQQLQQQEAEMFQQQYEATLQLQAQRAQTLASEAAQTSGATPLHGSSSLILRIQQRSHGTVSQATSSGN